MVRILRWLATAALAGLIIWSLTAHLQGWLFAFGTHPYPDGTPWTYQLESGFLPALTILGLVTLITGMWHTHNCHQDGCWRIGRHRIDGTPWCNRHATQAREIAAQTRDGRHDRLIQLLLAEAEARAAQSPAPPQ